MKIAALTLTAFGLAASGGCESREATARRTASGIASETAKLQRDAETACLCERRRGAAGKGTCWTSFENAMAAKHAEETGASLCAPISTESREWSDNEGQHSVILRYYTVGTSTQMTLCTVSEARTFEHAMNNAWSKRSEAAVKDAEKLARAMVSGQQFTAVPGKPTCG
ncbi:hypothetical protein NDN01_15095 [Sphingomonas sp. QA11]|uniref:hypothetical protein n=1 Tax=Sphingomonas sp. QA11 TaxID=2950605 RepID=UPI00234A2756|nr:hypothetical protein [Sphingomonas sp. QA11]WCM25383.1 hypothetical protein NDN01_15095 [Sphingomonas sp. QA11]